MLEGLRAVARRRASRGTKIDTVVIRGVNDDELADLIEFGRTVPAEVRFIEYMDVGGRHAVVDGARWWAARRCWTILGRRYGPIEPAPRGQQRARRPLPAPRRDGVRDHRLDHGALLCELRPESAHRGRHLVSLPLRPAGDGSARPLRGGATREELRALIASGWRGRSDRGAEERLQLRHRSPLVQIARLREDPHLEMHTRGG